MWHDPVERADTASATTFLLLWAMMLGLMTVLFGWGVHFFGL